MKLAPMGALATSIVVAVGIILIIPSYTEKKDPTPVVLSFVVTNDDGNIPKWCNDLAGILDSDQVKAVVFVSGKIAQAHSECASSFSKLGSVDVGSQTFSYANLTSIKDYTVALKEVQDGKSAVDHAGAVESKIFRAPNSLTDANIYSLLERSGILVDFSYADHYNRYENGQFVRYPLTRIENPKASQELFNSLSAAGTPAMLEFDNSIQPSDIHQFISELKSATSGKVRIVDASDLVGKNLTGQEGQAP
jgi:hypothetical protein